jgi:hypothetical protein
MFGSHALLPLIARLKIPVFILNVVVRVMATRQTRAGNATTRPGLIAAPAPRRTSTQVTAEKQAKAEKKAAIAALQAKKMSDLAAKELEMEAEDDIAAKVPHQHHRQKKPKSVTNSVSDSGADGGDGKPFSFC